ncbi:MAG: amino acid adenylation domain-containing protein [Pyrinomonadaceae bacterium]
MKNVEDIHPLSPMQQGMLFHTLYSPHLGVFFEQFTCKLKGRLNPDFLRRAWQQVIDRQQILRSAFVWEGIDEPLQVVRQRVTLPWTELDWSGLSPDELKQRLDEFLEQDRRRGFKLNKAPLIRVAVIKLPDEAVYMVLSFDHLLLDGWSMPIIINEVFAFYRAYSQGQELHLPRPHPYRDYIDWLQRQDINAAEKFWRHTLAGFTEPTPLVVNRRTGKPTGDEDFDEHFVQLSGELTAMLQGMAREHQLTLNTIMQGAWALLLSRYSGQRDVLFGAVVSGRPAELRGVEGMVGLFINTLPVRVKVGEEERGGEWLRGLQGEQAEARQYEYSPLVQVQGWSDVPRGVQLFDSVLSFQNYPVDSEAGGRSLNVSEVRTKERPTFPLNIKIMNGERIALRFVYDCEHFAAEVIERMAGHLKNILEGLALQPASTLGSLSLTDEAEQHELRAMWSGQKNDYGAGACVQHLFEAQAERTPDAVALVFEEEELTYAELNRRANQIARYLQSVGVGPELLVGVCMDNPYDVLMGMLGVLKAGGAYLPLDLSNPLERLSFMIEDAGVSVLLTQEHLLDSLPVGWAQPVCLGADRELIEQQSTENPAGETMREGLAYVIYTSGSTGSPKGVLVSHQGIGNLAEAQREALGIGTQSRVLQFASFNFDASVSEVFVTLLAGATLCLGTRESLMPGPALLKTMREMKITCVTLPPSVLAVMSPDELPSLQVIVSAGEACAPEIIERWGAGRRFVNGYGPTEATVCATMAINPPCASRSIIGRPINNTEVVILDGLLRPVPVNVVGELCIGTVGLARGYLNRQELTAERFIPHPFSSTPGARLYRTGDLARYRTDEQIEYVGRADSQVKVRGFRIELGEIEMALKTCVGVQDCVVLAREDEPGDKRLVAYVVGEHEAKSSIQDLRDQLKEMLPEYMLPSAFVFLDALPLNSSGKIDRKAMPAPDGIRPELKEVFVAPRTFVEQELNGIWAEVLRVDNIGVNDNFFELSGHSLLATQVVFRVKESLGVNLPLRSLFDTPTIAALAQTIELLRDGVSDPNLMPDDGARATRGDHDGVGIHAGPEAQEAASSWQRKLMTAATLVTIRAGGTKTPFFCVHPASGNVFGFTELARLLDDDRPFYGLQSRGLTEGFEPQSSIEEIAALYVEAMRSVQPSGPYLIGGWSMGAVVAFEMARQLDGRGQKIALLALMDARAPRSEGFQPGDDEESLLDGFALDLALSWKIPQLSWDRFFSLPASEKISYALEEARNASMLPANFGLSDMRQLLDVFKANVRALVNYIPQPYAHALTLFAAAASYKATHPDKGWSALAEGGVVCVGVPGDHHSMLSQPHVSILAEQLRNSIGRAEEADAALTAAHIGEPSEAQVLTHASTAS